jgi:hypothetical protein
LYGLLILLDAQSHACNNLSAAVMTAEYGGNTQEIVSYHDIPPGPSHTVFGDHSIKLALAIGRMR